MKFAIKWNPGAVRCSGRMGAWLAALAIGCLAECLAGEISLPALESESQAKDGLGVFSLLAWSSREKFPDVVEVIPLVPGEPKKEGAVWVAPATSRMNISVQPDGLVLHTNGRADKTAAYDWAPLVAFAPSAPGSYEMLGRVSLYSGKKEEEEHPIRWAILVTGSHTRVIHEGSGKGGEVIDLSALEELRRIELEAGESLGLTVWRNGWHWNGGARVAQLAVEKAK